MDALIFIILRSLKNFALEILRKPAKLVITALTIAAIVGVFLLSVFVRAKSENQAADIVWLKGIAFALYVLFVVIGVQKGLSRGDTIFTMSDVNLLFVSPLDSRRILLYGIVQMAKMSVIAGFFILFQGNSVCTSFDLSYGAVLLLFLGFILSVSLMQIVSMVMYSLTNGSKRRKNIACGIAAAAFAPIALVYLAQLFKTGGLMPALEAALRSPALSWTPVAGWAAEGTIALIAGDTGRGVVFYGLLVASAAALIVYIMRSNPDYYEDVLVATETAYEKRRAASEGKGFEAVSDRKIKISGTGIGGFGASALFYKHLRESFRSGRLGLWGLPSILTAVCAAVFAAFMREAGILTILMILMWTQLFLIGTGRGMKELLTHYVYMIPESAFSKILWSNAETVLKVLVESAVTFTAAGLIIGESAALIVLCIAVYTFFSFFLLGINYLFLRLTGMDISAGLTMIIYMAAVIVVMAPGIAGAIITGIAVGEFGGLNAALGVFTAWELICACLAFAAAKGILHKCDMMIIKTK